MADVSNKPWSMFTEADYSPEQWRRACLIDTGQGPPDAKERYKLPVREPSGVVNRNGVRSAMQALAGARTPIKAAPALKAQAARALIRLAGGIPGVEPTPTVRRLASQASNNR